LRRDNPGLFKRKFPLDPVSIPRKWQTDTASQSIDNNDFEVLIGILGIAAAAIIGCITNDSIDKPREKY
jgi:hypothetical protein